MAAPATHVLHASRVLLRRGAVTVGIAPECGAALTRFDVKVGGRRVEVLRRASDAHIHRNSPYGASSFPLIPYASRLREGKFEYRGRAFVFPINAPGERHSYHGDGWTRPWNVTELSRERAALEISPDRSAPIQYRAMQMIEVHGHGLTIKLRIQNLETSAIPIGVGLHPYFARRGGARVHARLPIRWRMDDELLPVGTEANPQASELERGMPAVDLPGSAAYSGWDGQALIEWPSDGIQVRIETIPVLHHAVVWAPPKEDFFCFEPVSHATNSFNLAREGIPAAEDQIIEARGFYEQIVDFSVASV